MASLGSAPDELTPEQVRARFATARRNGFPAWLWPNVNVAEWRAVVEDVVVVTRRILAGETNVPFHGSDVRTVGVAAYTSGMGPLLGFWIDKGIVQAEAEIADLLRLHLGHNRQRMHRLFQVAGETVEKLAGAGISPMILKGMHTAFRYFPEPGTRPLSDIDIYVPMESMSNAERVVSRLGYQRIRRTRSPYACDWIKSSLPQCPRTLTFVHEDDPWSLDILGALDKQLSTGARISLANLLPCAEPADWFSFPGVYVMRQPLLALYLATHISQALLNATVLRVLELVLVIRRDSAEGRFDWSGFLRGASAIGGPRFIYPALVFVEQLAPDTIPGEVMAAAARDAPGILRKVVDPLTIASAQPLHRHSVAERFMWAGTGRERLTQIAGELFIDGQGRPIRQSLYRIGTKLWALARGRYNIGGNPVRSVTKQAAPPGNIHRGKTYHEFMIASSRDRKARESFQRLVFQLVPPHGTILDFGAGTGIDAKSYAAKGFKVLVHEPCGENRDYLTEHCREEITNGAITTTDLSVNADVKLIAANFAVLNLIADHRSLFRKFACLVAPGGFVVVSMLNPWFVGDARYAWWRKNLRSLLRTGAYAVDGGFGPIYRFLPSAMVRAAGPDFHLVACSSRGLKIAVSRYTLMVFKRQ